MAKRGDNYYKIRKVDAGGRLGEKQVIEPGRGLHENATNEMLSRIAELLAQELEGRRSAADKLDVSDAIVQLLAKGCRVVPGWGSLNAINASKDFADTFGISRDVFVFISEDGKRARGVGPDLLDTSDRLVCYKEKLPSPEPVQQARAARPDPPTPAKRRSESRWENMKWQKPPRVAEVRRTLEDARAKRDRAKSDERKHHYEGVVEALEWAVGRREKIG